MSIRSLVALVSFAFLLAPASGSTLEEASSGFVSYQFDGDTHHDAPDTCSAAESAWGMPLGASTDGILVAPDDVSDVFVLDIPADRLGERLNVSLSEVADLESLEVTAFAPGCGSTVLDLLNWPAPEPSPPQPAPGESQTSIERPVPRQNCDPAKWVFWANVEPSYPPASTIHVAWTDGSERTVPVSYTHGSAHAVYTTTHALDTTVHAAWINMPADWDDELILAAGPCDTADGGAVYGEPPVAGMGFVEFTAVHAGAHVLQVTHRDVEGNGPMPIPAPVSVDPEPYMPHGLPGHDHDAGSHDHPDSDPSDGLSVEMPGPVVMPMTCHACIGGVKDLVERIDYLLSAVSS